MLTCTIVFEKNWDAMHRICDTCGGNGEVNSKPCTWCGDPENAPDVKGSGKYWRYIANVGSSRSSKTISLIDCCDLYARECKQKRITIWRDTKTDCKKTVLNDMSKRLKATDRYKVDQDFNKTESIFTYITDSTVEIHGTDDEETVHGLTQDVAWLNEPYKIGSDTFDQIDQRTADFVIFDINPKKDHWSDDIVKRKRCLLIYSTFRDNPFCPAESAKKLLSYQPVSMCHVVELGLIQEPDAMNYDCTENPLNFSEKHLSELRRCIENKHDNSANAFKWQVYGLGLKAERPNRIYNWKKIVRSEYDKIIAPTFYYSDWGKNHPWAIGEVKVYDGAFYVRELNYLSENKWNDQFSPEQRAAFRKDDESTGNAHDGLSIVKWMFDRLKVPKDRPIICDSNRPLKIQTLNDLGYNAFAAEKLPGSIIDGISILQEIAVYYTDDSPNIEYENENYSYKVDKYGTGTDDPEDKDNHHCDGIRYIALKSKQYGLI